MELAEYLVKSLGVKPPEDYVKFMEKYGGKLASDPVNEESRIAGLGDINFVVGTTLAFRSRLPGFSPGNIVIGYLGIKPIVIARVNETLDNYLALDTKDGRVLAVDSLGAGETIAEDFEEWVRPELLRSELKQKYGKALTVVLFDDEPKAEEARSKLLTLQREGWMELEDAVVVVKEADGKTRYRQNGKTARKGGTVGSLTGLLVGALLMHPLLGLVLGAATGIVSAELADTGIEDSFIEDLAANFSPGSSALFALVGKSQPDKVLEAFHGFGGKILATSISKENADAMQACLDAAGGEGPSGRQECPQWVVRGGFGAEG